VEKILIKSCPGDVNILGILREKKEIEDEKE